MEFRINEWLKEDMLERKKYAGERRVSITFGLWETDYLILKKVAEKENLNASRKARRLILEYIKGIKDLEETIKKEQGDERR